MQQFQYDFGSKQRFMQLENVKILEWISYGDKNCHYLSKYTKDLIKKIKNKM